MIQFVLAVVVLTSPKPTMPPLQPWHQVPYAVCFAKKNSPCNTSPVKIQYAHMKIKAKKASPKQ